MTTNSDPSTTLYQAIGGDAPFRRLVDAFYDRIEHDPLLRPLFPPDLGPGKEWQFLFLTQYFGGPRRYEAERGHPRLRMRHMPFAISPREASRWLAHMLVALQEAEIPEPHAATMREYFAQAASAMVNRPPDGIEPPSRAAVRMLQPAVEEEPAE